MAVIACDMASRTSALLCLALAVACGDDSTGTTAGGSGTTASASSSDSGTPPGTTGGAATGSGGAEGSTGAPPADSSTSAPGTDSGSDSTGAGTTGSDESSGGSTDEGSSSGSSSGGEESSSSSDSGMVGPGECNETLGAPCGFGMYCDYPDDMCGEGLNGTCMPSSDFCPAIFDPHCGCDGVTHGNVCEAGGAGTDVAHPGPC